ncbi:MAG: energy transducer TonB [Candidatus Omnitrophica bacterium]|nr:energy transducer TonB [Candidatus Omnitrophota bacterium]
MKKINDLQACLIISLIAHAGLLGSGMMHFNFEQKDKPFEVAFEVEEEILPEVFEVNEEKIIEPLVIDKEDVIEPVPDESIIEAPNPAQEDEEIKKSLLRYQDSIKQKIQKEKQYPRWALRSGHQGNARITFSVLPSGQIEGLRLISSSGFDELDKESLDAVKRASPFLSFPEELNESEIKVELDIMFHITIGAKE